MRVVKRTPDIWRKYQFSLHISGRRHPDNNVFCQLQQLLRGTESLIPKAFSNADHPRTVQTPAKEDAVVPGVEWEPRWEITLSKIT
jgi:hypothetical protein